MTAETKLRDEACPVCGQPDNCGDCNHVGLTDAEWAKLGEKMEDWPSPTGQFWENCGYCRCDNEFVLPDPIPAGNYWHKPEWGSTVYCSEGCCNDAAEEAHERMLEQFHGGERWP